MTIRSSHMLSFWKCSSILVVGFMSTSVGLCNQDADSSARGVAKTATSVSSVFDYQYDTDLFQIVSNILTGATIECPANGGSISDATVIENTRRLLNSSWTPPPLMQIFSPENALMLSDYSHFSPGKMLLLANVESEFPIPDRLYITTAFGGIEVWLKHSLPEGDISWYGTTIGIPLSLGYNDYVHVQVRRQHAKIMCDFTLWGPEFSILIDSQPSSSISVPGCTNIDKIFSVFSFASSMLNARSVEPPSEARHFVQTGMISSIPFDIKNGESYSDRIRKVYASCMRVVVPSPESTCTQMERVWSKTIDFVAVLKQFPFPIVCGDTVSQQYCGRFPFIAETNSGDQPLYGIRIQRTNPISLLDNGLVTVRVESFSHAGSGLDYSVYIITFQKYGTEWLLAEVDEM